MGGLEGSLNFFCYRSEISEGYPVSLRRPWVGLPHAHPLLGALVLELVDEVREEAEGFLAKLGLLLDLELAFVDGLLPGRID